MLQKINLCLDYDNVNKLYHSAIVNEEYLQDTDKYWCEQCCRYNEAKRSVGYESLPRLLTLHLKRFCTNYRYVFSKLNCLETFYNFNFFLELLFLKLMNICLLH